MNSIDGAATAPQKATLATVAEVHADWLTTAVTRLRRPVTRTRPVTTR